MKSFILVCALVAAFGLVFAPGAEATHGPPEDCDHTQDRCLQRWVRETVDELTGPCICPPPDT